MQNFKPLLAERKAPDLAAVRFPVLVSPKIDGIRALTGVLKTICSRELEPIPNLYIRRLTSHLPPFLDGELLTYTNGRRDDFNTVQSKVMSEDGKPSFGFHVFDHFEQPDWPFWRRYARSVEESKDDLVGVAKSVPHREVNDVTELIAFESVTVDEFGWEGVMLRDPRGVYKFGRSTMREGILLKLKRFEDDEGIVTGFVERMHNANEAVTDNLGFTKRSSSKANLVPTGTLGALQVAWKGVSFKIGTGFDDTTRQDLWDRRESLIGQKVTFKFQGVGSKGRPRFPSFIGIRKDI